MLRTDVASGAGAPSEREPAVVEGHRLAKWLIPMVVLATGLVVTAGLAFTARHLHASNEKRLLRQRVREAGAVVAAATTNVQAPLQSAEILVEATDADAAAFTNLMTPLAAGSPFVSASVWPAHARDPRPLVVVGATPELSALPAADRRALLARAGVARARASNENTMVVRDLLGDAPRSLGYAYSSGPTAKYVVYAQASFPENRRAAVDSNSAFADLDYAIYLKSSANPDNLLASSLGSTRLSGRTAHDVVPFGDAKLDLVMSSRHDLGGTLLAHLAWLIVGVGAVIALAAALLTERLVRGRAHAEELAQLNARLFSEQRSVAQTLQHSLLPTSQPEFPGLDLAVRYVPGVDGVDIGGDWYDVIDVGVGQVMLVIGDVSGRGLRAATVMASLRYAIQAYALQGDPPEVILAKLAKVIDVRRDGHFATVVCGLVDVADRRVTFANAGHPKPLLIEGASVEFVDTNVGAPVGVANGTTPPMTVVVPPDGVLLAFTDGIFERRGESPDVGLERLRAAAGGYDTLDELLDGLLHTLTPDGGNDDTAILAMRWLP